MLAGCTIRTPSANRLDTLAFSANLKSDAFSSSGKKAACYADRIYYLSSETGTQGICSMKTDGTDLRLELPVEDIRAIQVRNDGIYYSGFHGMAENDWGSYRQFRLYSLTSGSKTPVDYLSTCAYSDDLRDENVWDFVLDDSGCVVVRFVNIVGYNGDSGLSVVTFRNNQAISFSQYALLEDSSRSAVTKSNQALFNLVRLNDLYFVPGNYALGQSEAAEQLYGRGTLSVYDANRQQPALPIDRLYSAAEAYNAADFPRWIARVDGNTILFASVRGLFAYDMDTKMASDIVSFALPDCLYAQIDCGNNILVFTERLRSSYRANALATRIFRQNRMLGETLYRVDVASGVKTPLLTIGRNQSFVYASAQLAAAADGKTIRVYDIGTDTPSLIQTIRLRHAIVDSANKVDTAGGWLFLYRFNEETGRNELLEKVYLGA